MSSIAEATPVILTSEERTELESLARSTKTEIGVVAGVVVGYTAGPSWGLRGHRHYRRAAREFAIKPLRTPKPLMYKSRRQSVPLNPLCAVL